MSSESTTLSLQEAYDQLLDRIKTIEFFIVDQKIRNEVQGNVLSMLLMASSDIDSVKEHWDSFVSSGLEARTVGEYLKTELSEENQNKIKKSVKSSIEQWSQVIDMVVDSRSK